jgi:hypothetical protein
MIIVDEKRNRMIEALNSLVITDWSASCGELEYVQAANTEENRKKLFDAGFTQEMIDEATDGMPDNDIDLTCLAVNHAGVYCWHKSKGFIEEEELAELSGLSTEKGAEQ